MRGHGGTIRAIAVAPSAEYVYVVILCFYYFYKKEIKFNNKRKPKSVATIGSDQFHRALIIHLFQDNE